MVRVAPEYFGVLNVKSMRRSALFVTASGCAAQQVALPAEIRQFVQASTGNYGKVKLVLQRNAFFVESPFPDVLHTLLQARQL